MTSIEDVDKRRIAFAAGGMWSEINTILGRIRRRRSGEPTAWERARLAELKAKIGELKAGTQRATLAPTPEGRAEGS